MALIYVGETGIEITLNTHANLSNYSLASIKYKKPSGETGTWTPEVNTGDSTNTKLIYTTVEDDLDEAGRWKVQPYVETEEGGEYYGDAAYLYVNEVQVE